MAKIQLLAVLSLDGCLSDMETEGRFWLRPDLHGMDEIHEKATFELSPDYSLTELIGEHKKLDDTIYLIEANKETADFINAMLRMRLVDEIILYTVPFIAGTGLRLFQGNLPISYWEPVEETKYGRVLRRTYRRREVEED